MKRIQFVLLLLFSIKANAYLPQGVSPDVQVFNHTTEVVTGVTLEGCNSEKCQRPDTTSACTSAGEAKWSCHLDDPPSALRFKVRTANAANTPRTSDYRTTNGEHVGNFAVHVSATAVDVVPLGPVVIQLNTQEMLENVWDADTVKQMRASKPSLDRWSDIKSAQKFELTGCEFQDCKIGQLKTATCTFSTKGISKLSYSCPMAAFARFAKIKFFARDKVRTSEIFVLGSRYEADLKSSDQLEVRPSLR